MKKEEKKKQKPIILTGLQAKCFWSCMFCGKMIASGHEKCTAIGTSLCVGVNYMCTRSYLG